MDFDFYTKAEINAMLGGLYFAKISKADFDALDPKDPNTVYFVYDENGNIVQYFGDSELSSGKFSYSDALAISNGGVSADIISFASQEV